MSQLLNRRLALLSERANLSLLEQCLHGIERECLRVTADARLAQTPHPEELGSAPRQQCSAPRTESVAAAPTNNAMASLFANAKQLKKR